MFYFSRMRFTRIRRNFAAEHCRKLVEKSSWETYICIKAVKDAETRRSLFALNVGIKTHL